MTQIIDISLPLRPAMPIWPGDPPFQIERIQRMEDGSIANVSKIHCCVHVGTHVDAPYHFIHNGRTAEQLSLDMLVGEAEVAYLPEIDTITMHDLESLALPADTRRLLLRTRNSAWWTAGVTSFREDFAALTADAAQWLVDHHIHLIGVDYLSVQLYHDGPLTHQILLKAGTIILEGLSLDGVEPGRYELICLPLNLVGADGAPARAILRTLPTV